VRAKRGHSRGRSSEDGDERAAQKKESIVHRLGSFLAPRTQTQAGYEVRLLYKKMIRPTTVRKRRSMPASKKQRKRPFSTSEDLLVKIYQLQKGYELREKGTSFAE